MSSSSPSVSPYLPPSLLQTDRSDQPMHESPELDRQQDEELERETAKLRAHFEEKMTNKTPGHRRVAVLILYWDPQYGPDLDVTNEVEQLREIFEITYGFKIYDGKLDPRKARDSINFYMADLMLQENYENTLLIIYYAGHGGLAMGTSDGLKLTGGQSVRVDTGKEIIWDKAEALLEDVEADMLLIFDCCHAARAGNRKKRSSFLPRIYEVLAACQADELTPGPGPDSFTSALIWALKRLAEPPRAFTTSQLYDMILNSPQYKAQDNSMDRYTSHHPYWSEKAGYHSLHRLKITPKSVQEEQTAEPPSQPAKFDMHIQLLSTEIPNIEDISKLCQKLRDVLHPDDPGSTFHQALWRDLAPARVQKERLPHVAEIFTLKLKQKRLQSRINQISGGESGGSEVPISPFSRDELMASEAVLDTRAQTRHSSSLTTSSPPKTGTHAELAILQDQIREKLSWLITGISLALLGYYWGGSRNISRR